MLESMSILDTIARPHGYWPPREATGAFTRDSQICSNYSNLLIFSVRKLSTMFKSDLQSVAKIYSTAVLFGLKGLSP